MAEVASSQVSVIGPRFCVPNSVDLSISERVWQITRHGDFVVKDLNDNLFFKIETPSFSARRVMLDSAGVPIVTLRPKSYSGRNRWRVFRGDSTEERELIFSVRRSSRFQSDKILQVFLAGNMSENVPDYTVVQRGWIHRSCEIYVRDSSTIIAQMQEDSSFTGKDKFRVTVFSNIDYAFIVALIIIKHGIRKARTNNGGATMG